MFKKVFVFPNTVQRHQSMVLEQNQSGYNQSIPISDLIPKELKDKRGKYTITIEFEEI